ncbi:SDR family NAD(P)-dependent oxidoreductase [Streptomyces filamentosus]|uniref:SDR family NAD(P)-dependent oxidoreductase n=1 Tax=Streptomyces filamentosus TaxID=67294 RepID=UPI003F4CE4D3
MVRAGADVVGLDLRPSGDEPFPVLGFDVTDDASVAAAVAEALELLGGLDVLVNNAGVGGPAPAEYAPAEYAPGEEVRRQLEVNLLGTWRVTAARVGALVAAGGRGDYALMALVLASVTAVSAGVALVGARRLTDACGFRVPDERAGHAVLADLRVAWRDRDYRAPVLSYLFTGTTTHLFLAALPYVTAYVFDDTRLTALFMGLFLAPALFASPLWTAWSRRFGKQRGLLLSQGVFAAGSLALLVGALLGGTAGVAVAAVVVMVMGVAFAGLQLFAFSMVPDAVAAAGAAGSSKAGAYTGVWTATEATGTAIGPYLYSAVLALGGFVSRTAAEPVAQSGTALGALLVGFTVVPAVLMAVALGFQRRYTLDPAA